MAEYYVGFVLSSCQIAITGTKGTNDSLNEDEPLTVEEEDDIGDNDGRDKQNIIDQGTGETQDESPLEVLSIE